MGYFIFSFQRPEFFPPCRLYPTLSIKKQKILLILLKVTKFHDESVKNESSSTKKKLQKTSPACLGLNSRNISGYFRFRLILCLNILMFLDISGLD